MALELAQGCGMGVAASVTFGVIVGIASVTSGRVGSKVGVSAGPTAWIVSAAMPGVGEVMIGVFV